MASVPRTLLGLHGCVSLESLDPLQTTPRRLAFSDYFVGGRWARLFLAVSLSINWVRNSLSVMITKANPRGAWSGVHRWSRGNRLLQQALEGNQGVEV